MGIAEFPAEQERMQGRIYYTFDSDLRVKSVTFDDPLLKTHERLSKEGKVTEPLDDRYAETLKKAVQYWDGEKFVLTPTRNRRYLNTGDLP